MPTAREELPPDALRRFESALEHTAENRAELAVPTLRELVAGYPEFTEAYEVLGVAYDKLGRFDEGIAVLEEMVRRDPDAKMGWVNLSRLYVAKGMIDEAEEAKGKATVAAMKELAREAKANKQGRSESVAQIEAPPIPQSLPEAVDEERVQLFERAVEEDPTNDIALFSLGKMYAATDRDGLAVKRLQQLIELRPDYSAAYLPLGEALARLGEVDRAREIYDRGIAVADERGDLVPRNKMRARLRRLSS